MKDLIILGNGMAGMTAALYAKRANLDFKIVGRDEYDFGQIGNAILVENYPCVDKMTGFELAMKLYDQLTEDGIEIEERNITRVMKCFEPIKSLGYKPPYYLVEYDDGMFDYAKTVIYALGAKHRELPCPVEDGIPIHYCALCDGTLYEGKTVAIIGGGDVAFTQAEYLSNICKQVNIIMCDRNVTASPSTVERVKKLSNISIYYDFVISEIAMNKFLITDNNEERKFIISRQVPDDGRARLLATSADAIFVAIGMAPNTKLLTDDFFNIIDKNGYLVADEDCACFMTPGFYAAGDVRKKALRQSITAAADGANAVNSAMKYLRENR